MAAMLTITEARDALARGRERDGEGPARSWSEGPVPSPTDGLAGKELLDFVDGLERSRLAPGGGQRERAVARGVRVAESGFLQLVALAFGFAPQPVLAGLRCVFHTGIVPEAILAWYAKAMTKTREVDEQGLELARQMEQAAYLVRQTLTNKEWLIAKDEDYATTLAAAKAAHAAAQQRYMDYEANV